ncbi:nitrilase-related carbon-nitrogen hydrolase [Baekduia sp. Peel2402]|uniref:nitrilase-related carbon-nitrogen hydrolase n=1 Tax=Baekduia sp. Peel2402 TaxID=3458296 RepID=UPI00403E69D5
MGAVDDNLIALRAALADALAADAGIVVATELAGSGYAFADAEEARAHAEDLDGPTVSAYRDASQAGGGAVVVGGFCERGDDGNTYNSAVAVEAGEVLAVYRKLHLWHDEQSCFTPGAEVPPVVETHHGRIGVAICYDLEFPEVTRSLALRGADLLALPTNWPRTVVPPGERSMLGTLAMATARLSRTFVAVCDRAGAERGVDYEGASIIAGPDGYPLAESTDPLASQVLTATADLAHARDKRTGPRNDVVTDRRPDLY